MARASRLPSIFWELRIEIEKDPVGTWGRKEVTAEDFRTWGTVFAAAGRLETGSAFAPRSGGHSG